MDCKPDGFPIPNSHGLVGNVDWGESLAVVAYEFPGLNRFLGLAIIGLPYFEIPMLLLEIVRNVNLLQEGSKNLLSLYNLFQ